MNSRITNRLVKDFPLLYADRKADPRVSLMCFGFDHGDGWKKIIRDLSKKLEPLIQKIIDENPNLPCIWCGEDCLTHAPDGSYARVDRVPYRFDIGFSHTVPMWKYDSLKQYVVKFFSYRLWCFKYRLNRLSYLLLKKFNIGSDQLYTCPGYKPNFPRAIQVKEKFGCYDEQTEVLTRKGWKLFKDISKEDEIASLQNGEYLVYQKPSDIISYRYDGEMYRLKTRGVDLLVTPNHNLYVAKGSYYNGRYSPPKKVDHPLELTTYQKYFKKNKRFKKSARWLGEEVITINIPGYDYTANMILSNQTVQNKPVIRNYSRPGLSFPADTFFRFLGWYIAEGCSDGDKGDIHIACNNTDGGAEKQIIGTIIKSCGIEIKTSLEQESALLFHVYSKALAKWLSSNCGSDSYTKKIPDCVKSASPRQIKLFLESLFSGDGQKTDTAYILTTVSKQLANDVQECLLKAGDVGRIYKSTPPGTMRGIENPDKIYNTAEAYEINWLMDSHYHNTQNKGLSPSSIEQIEEYHGQVYCVTVPKHVIYIRRNGIPVWCGNSLRFYMTSSTDEMLRYTDEAEQLSEITCEKCGKKGELRSNYGWYSTLCETCAVNRDGKRIPTYKELEALESEEEDAGTEE